ncbi:MAG: 6,7-dimethyl-8-ribityllumazine synthase [Verrucomicrobiota bacterium JB023]|nr:6,7-dimethyl-8-ribityllumazine synthase [Verrucomicrobiota bacterium JB023]
MSQALAPKPRVLTSGKNRIAIVASQFNEKYTDALVEFCVDELSSVMPQARVDLIRVPGAYEIPLATKLILKNENPAAVICLGVIIEGETAHADLIATSVTDSLLAMSLQYEVPVIHEVLLVETEEQARARCLGTELNRGKDAANAAAAMVEVSRELGRNR